MDIQKLLLVGHSHDGMTESFSFKLSADVKERFIAVCLENELSTGRVMRELVRQFIEEIESNG